MRRLRENAGLTQKQAAEKLDMNPRTYGAYEREERDVSYKQMQKIKRVMGGKVETSISRSYDGSVKQYEVAGDGGESSTVYIDSQIIPVNGTMPEPHEATAHHVNTRFMGPWMDSDLVLAREVEQIDGPGRYVIRWADGEDKTVVEAWRHSNDQICVRFHAPERRVVMTEVRVENGVTVFRKQDGSEIDVEVLGVVVFPDDATQMMTEGMADTASRIINGGGE